MLKKSHYIFIFLFLSGMIFTVIKYIPILEEEVHSHRLELSKKSASLGSPSDLDGGDDHPENENIQMFYDNFYMSLAMLEKELNFLVRPANYLAPLENINTPPPRV